MTRTLAVIVFCVWLMTAAAYLYAVAVPASTPPKTTDDSSQFAENVWEVAKKEGREIDKRSRRASRLAAVAGLLTVAAVLSMIVTVNEKRVPVDILLNPGGASQLPPSCKATEKLGGHLLPQSSTTTLIDVIISAGQCGDQPVRLFIPSSDVRSVIAR